MEGISTKIYKDLSQSLMKNQWKNTFVLNNTELHHDSCKNTRKIIVHPSAQCKFTWTTFRRACMSIQSGLAVTAQNNIAWKIIEDPENIYQYSANCELAHLKLI